MTEQELAVIGLGIILAVVFLVFFYALIGLILLFL